MKKILFILVIILCSITIVNAIRQISLLFSKQAVLVKAQSDLKKAQDENKSLKQKLSYVQTNGFIEEEARNKLFLVKNGESTVLISKSLLSSDSAKVIVVKQEANWQQWLDAFQL